MFCTTFRRLLTKTFHEAAEIASVAQRNFPRLPSGVDHVAIDVTSLASTAGRFTRDMIGRERDEEAVKIVMKAIQTNVLRRLKVKKSIAFFMDGTNPLWKVHHLRQFPGKMFDRAFYRSAASPMVYLLEEHLLKLVTDLRGSSAVLECVVSGPSTPGPAAMKITAWLLDIYARTLPTSLAASTMHSLKKLAGEEKSSLAAEEGKRSAISAAPVTTADSIILIGEPEDVHLNSWGATVWTPNSLTSPASFSTVSFDQRDVYSLSLAESLEWLGMGDVYQSAITSGDLARAGNDTKKGDDATLPSLVSPSKHALAARRTDAVWLYLLGFGSPAFGLPPLLGSVSFAQWMTAYGQELSRQTEQLQKTLSSEKGAEEKGSSPSSSSSLPSRVGGKGAAVSAPSPVLHPSVLGTLIHAYPSERLSSLIPKESNASSASETMKNAEPKAEDGTRLQKRQGGEERMPAAHPTLSPLRLNVDAMRRVLLAASQRTTNPSGKYHAAVEHYLEVALQTLHAYTFGFLPNLLYSPSDPKANFGEKGMRGVSVEHVLSHLQYLLERATVYSATLDMPLSKATSPTHPTTPSAPGRSTAASSTASLSSTALCCHRVSVASPVTPPSSSSAVPLVELYSRCASLSSGEIPDALTGAQQLCLSTTKPEYLQQVLPVMTRGHAPTAAQVSSIIEAKTAADALPKVQELLPPHHDAFRESPKNVSSESAKDDGKEAVERCSWIDGALCFHPSHYVCRSGAGAISPWQYHSVDLGVKSEALNVRSMLS